MPSVVFIPRMARARAIIIVCRLDGPCIRCLFIVRFIIVLLVLVRWFVLLLAISIVHYILQ